MSTTVFSSVDKRLIWETFQNSVINYYDNANISNVIRDTLKDDFNNLDYDDFMGKVNADKITAFYDIADEELSKEMIKGIEESIKYNLTNAKIINIKAVGEHEPPSDDEIDVEKYEKSHFLDIDVTLNFDIDKIIENVKNIRHYDERMAKYNEPSLDVIDVGDEAFDKEGFMEYLKDKNPTSMADKFTANIVEKAIDNAIKEDNSKEHIAYRLTSILDVTENEVFKFCNDTKEVNKEKPIMNIGKDTIVLF